MTARFSITMPDEVFQELEKQRGKTDRSVFISDLVRASVGMRAFPVVVHSADELLELAAEVKATRASMG